MASLIPCPHCGLRPKEEFSIRGRGAATSGAGCEPKRRGSPMFICATIRAAAIEEYWHHAGGCRRWLIVTRDTLTHERDRRARRREIGRRRMTSYRLHDRRSHRPRRRH